MLDAVADEGSLNENDIEYIKNVFKLDGMTAEDVMTPRRSIVFIPQTASKEDIMEVIETEGYSRIPVFSQENDSIIGILHTRDFLLKHSKPDFKIEDVMFQPTFVPTTAHLDVLFKDMQKEHNHIVVVINEYGEIAGIVTMEDILEEIVGEIWDERDEAVENFTELSENKYKVLCSTNIEEFFEFFEIEPEEETESATINGWIIELIGSIPEEGFSFDYKNLNIEVVLADEFMAQEITVVVNEIPEEVEE
jgi:CBS domain containing-hemolysin-like protein